MTADLLDILGSLTAITTEETASLTDPNRRADAPALAPAKARLVAALETRMSQLARQAPDWMQALDAEERDRLADATRDLRDAAALNGRVLQRQIDLSDEMMAAVAAEAKRLTGARGSTYGMHGGLSRTDRATPISLNTRL